MTMILHVDHGALDSNFTRDVCVCVFNGFAVVYSWIFEYVKKCAVLEKVQAS